MKTFGVAGHPVVHSRSPDLHNAWFHALGIDARYVRLDVDPAALGEPAGANLLQRLDQLGFAGVNLTVPLKQLCVGHVHQLAPTARLTGAINTLVRHEDGWHGSNTDVEGFRRAAVDAEADLTGRVVVLGAGGAARAVLAALLPTAAHITLLNRTTGRAESVARSLGGGIAVGKLDGAALAGADLVVNAVAGPGIPAIAALAIDRVPSTAVWMDLNYWCEDPPHERALIARGVRFDRGFRMLLHQGALAFEQFCGQAPPLASGWGVLTGTS